MKDSNNAAVIILSSVAAGFSLAILGVYGISIFGNSGFVKLGVPKIVPLDFTGGYTETQFWGIALAIVCLPLTIIPITIATAKCFLATKIPRFFRFAFHLSLGLLFVKYALIANDEWLGYTLLDCSIVACAFNTYELTHDLLNAQPHGFYPTLGVISCLVLVSFSIVEFLLAATLMLEAVISTMCQLDMFKHRYRTLDDVQSHLLDVETDVSRYQTENIHTNRQKVYKMLALFTAILLPAVFMVLASIFPSTWLLMTRERISKSASLKIETEASKCRITEVISSLPPLEPFQQVICPELPNSYFRTVAVELRAEDNEKRQQRVIAKVYADVLIFFVFLFSTVIIGVVTTYSPLASGYLLKPLKLPLVAYTNLSNILISILFSMAVTAWVIYWYHDHNWHSYWPISLPFVHAPTVAEKLARTAGQTGNLLMGLLVLPVTRNSVWLHVFNICREKALRVHIYLAYSFLTTVLVHMVCFWVVYSEQGIFPHDVLATVMYFPLNFHAKPGGCSLLSCLDPEYQVPAGDNWTIPVMTYFMTFIGFPVFGVFTYYTIRRVNFELFYYSHHLFLVLFFAVFWHASSSWMFISLGLVLWIVDRLLGFFNSLGKIHVGSIISFKNAHITGLWFSKYNFHPRPGQYVYLNIPELSEFQWHPFSVSGYDPGCKQYSIHASACGDFTKALYYFADRADMNLEDLQVRIDGPYGIPYDVKRYQYLFMIAGGIGITPLIYLLGSEDIRQHKKVMLLWIAKRENMFLTFQHELIRAANFENIHIFLFLTEGAYSADAWNVTRITKSCRRPKVKEALDAHLREGDAKTSSDTIVLTCGPESLTRDVEIQAYKHGIKSRQEYFGT